jgi:hypothetical protein
LHTRLRLGFFALHDYCIHAKLIAVILPYVFVAWNMKLLSIISYYVPVLLLNIMLCLPLSLLHKFVAMLGRSDKVKLDYYVERI